MGGNATTGAATWPTVLRAAGTGAPDTFAELLAAALRPEWHPDELVVAACHALDADPHHPISDLAASLKVAPGRLLARFRRACGIAPKAYADLARFHRFVTQFPFETPLPQWSQLAVEAGYYDQPHFIRSFRSFVGCTPTQYLAAVREHGSDYALFVPLEQA